MKNKEVSFERWVFLIPLFRGSLEISLLELINLDFAMFVQSKKKV